MSADGSILLPLAGKTIRVADLFCGAGGTSTGARRAITELGGAMQLTAVNHWTVAIETHTRMHPDATHLCADLESVRPREAVPGGVLDLLMASPTCTYHSRARGGRPVHDQQRMDPWHVVRWATELRVHRLLVENVPEMVEWGPCSIVTGRPIPSRRGEYFRAWLEALKAIGFRVDWRVLCCADYGDPTTRERFFLIGRSDRKALRWPEPSHIKGGRTDLFGTRKPWRAAAEIIDWSREGKSIFGRKKPLKPNTLRRIHAGAVRNRWPQPYIDALDALMAGREPVLDFELVDGVWQVPPAMVMAPGSTGAARDIGQPTPTVVGSVSHHLIEPLLMGVSSNAAAHPVSMPAPTITTGGGSASKRPGNARPQLIEPLLAPYYGSTAFAQPVTDPVPAVTTKARFGLAEPIVMRGNVGDGRTGDMRPASEPMPTVTCSESLALAQALIVPVCNSSSAGVPRSASLPLATITTVKGGDKALATPVIVPVTHHGDRKVNGVDEPLPTITGANRGELGIASAEVINGDRQRVRIDIHYRMLHWRELAGAMSFDDAGEIYQFAGNGTEITKQIGNAVPGRTAKALVSALVSP